MDVMGAFAYAQEEINYLQSKEEFLLKDLFKGYEWNRIKKSDRLKLGTMFLNYVENNGDKIIILSKTKSGQKLYKKK